MSPIPSKTTASNVEKYLTGYALLALTGAVITLFWLYISLNTFIREDLTRQNVEMKLIIQKNNEVINNLKP